MPTGKYDGEQVQVTFTADEDRTSEGTHSTYWISTLDNIDVDTVTILGVELTAEEYNALPERLREAIMDLADDVDWDYE